MLDIFGCSLFPTEYLPEQMVTGLLGKDWVIVTYTPARLVQGTSG